MKVKVAQLCPALCDPRDYTAHGILQARILEWVAFPFRQRRWHPTLGLLPGRSHGWRSLVGCRLRGRAESDTTEATYQQQQQQQQQPFPSPGDLPNPGIKPRSPTLQVDSLPAEPPRKPKNTGVCSLSLFQQIFLTQESNRGLLHCRQIL